MCDGVSSFCGNFSKTISLGSGFLMRKLPLELYSICCGKSTCNILLWWYTPCFCDGNGGGGDKGLTLHVTLMGDVMVDVFIFIVDVGDWRHCSCNSAMVLFSQLCCSLLLM